MSKRRRDAGRRERDPQARAGGRPPRDAPPALGDRAARDTAPRGRPADGRPPRDGPRAGRILRDVLILAVAFGVGVGLAELFGAANLGVAFGVGQIVFAIALVVLLTRD
jgi:hypothetical protein